MSGSEDEQVPAGVETTSGEDLGCTAGMQAENVNAMAQVVSVLGGLVDRVNRREVPAPEVFTISGGRSIEDFFREFEAYAAQKFGQSQAGWLPRLGQFLAEPLCRLYQDMRATGADYASVKGHLVKCFGAQVGPKTSLDCIQEFQQVKYIPEEGIPGLVCRLQALAERAYRGLAEDVLGELVKQQCWKVLPESLRTPLQFQNLANPGMTLPELIRLGVALQRSDLASASMYSMKSTEPGEGLPSTKITSSSPARGPPRLGAAAGGPKQCSHCGKKGHLKKECYRLNQRCYGCGERGHFRAQCPNPQPREEATGGRSPVSGSPAQGPSSPAIIPGPSCPFCGASGHLMATCPDFEIFMTRLLNKRGVLN